VDVANISTTYNGKIAIMAVLRDIGERKRMEKALEESGLEPKYLELEITESVLKDIGS
jgi:EAL domain-containing protein (putative c-di-GMP-specific phosphodiesterase class I)